LFSRSLAVGIGAIQDYCYEITPSFSDSVDDGATGPFLLALPNNGMKDLSKHKTLIPSAEHLVASKSVDRLSAAAQSTRLTFRNQYCLPLKRSPFAERRASESSSHRPRLALSALFRAAEVRARRKDAVAADALRTGASAQSALRGQFNGARPIVVRAVPHRESESPRAFLLKSRVSRERRIYGGPYRPSTAVANRPMVSGPAEVAATQPASRKADE
jgi:hypothetical protein